MRLKALAGRKNIGWILTMNKYVIDTSAWIEYFGMSTKGAKIKEIIETEEVATSIIGVAELAYFCEKEGHDAKKIIDFVSTHSAILSMSIQLAMQAAKIKKKMRERNGKFGLADAIHLSTASDENATLITTDNDFAGVENVMVV